MKTSKLLPNVFDYIKNTRRIIRSNDCEELNYRVSAYLNKDYDISKEIIELTFEEFANFMAEGNELLFSFGTLGINLKPCVFYCRVHSKFRKSYGTKRTK